MTPATEIAVALARATDRAVTAKLGARQLRVLLVVIQRTAGAGRLNTCLYLADLARTVLRASTPTPDQVNQMGKDLTDLADAGAIDREPPRRGRPRRGGACYVVWLPEAPA